MSSLIEDLAKKLAAVDSSHEAKWIVEHLRRLGSSEAAERAATTIVDRRLTGEPLAYILGSWAFRSHDFAVGPGALIPRPETEELVEYALAFAEKSETLLERIFGDEGLTIVDAGAGSGCIGLSFVADLLADLQDEAFDPKEISSKLKLHLIEKSPDALPFLKKNVERLRPLIFDCNVEIFSGSWQDWKARPIDVLLANPPYLTLEELGQTAESVQKHEPHTALVPADITDFPDASGPYRELIALAETQLQGGAFAIFELGIPQPTWLKTFIPKLQNFDNVRLFKDMAGKERFFTMRKKEDG